MIAWFSETGEDGWFEHSGRSVAEGVIMLFSTKIFEQNYTLMELVQNIAIQESSLLICNE